MEMLDWHKSLNNKNIIIFYSGPLWSEGIGEIAVSINKRLELDDMPRETTQKLISVFIEQMNNMLMYSAEKNAKFPKGTFVLGRENEAYFIQTGNVIKNDSINFVKNKIDFLNTLDKNKLHEYYKEQILNVNKNSQSPGAGLGLIEIARRAKSKIVYSFVPYEKEFSFFILYVTIGDEDE